MKKLFLALFLGLVASATEAWAQEVPMADALRADGKIWVVVATIAILWAGILTYLVRLDGRITKLEKAVK